MTEENDKRRCFPARTAAWEDVRSFVEARSSRLGLPRSAALRLELIAEELFINAVEHGHRGDGRPITVCVTDAGKEVELAIEDGADAFNPFADLGRPSDSPDPGDRPVGGLGRQLVAGLSSRWDYVRLSDGNRVTVAVPKERGATKPRR